MGEYCNYHLAQGVADHSKIAYKGQVLVEPVDQSKYDTPLGCNGIKTDKTNCGSPAVWQTSCYVARERIEWVGKPVQ